MSYIPLNYLIRPLSSPENRDFLNTFFSQFDTGIGINKKIVDITPLYYAGSSVGSEFIVNVPTKIYLTLSFICVPVARVVIFNEIGATIVNYSIQVPLIINNIYFSFLTFNLGGGLVFNGYRITLI